MCQSSSIYTYCFIHLIILASEISGKATILFPENSQEDLLDDYDYNDGDHYTSHPGAPECAKAGQTYCEDVNDYPTERLQSILHQDIGADQRSLFAKDAVTPFEVKKRTDSSAEDITYCNSNTVVIYPKMALSVDNYWSFIVNQDNFTQGVRVELCTPSEGCLFDSHLPMGYGSQCRQKFMERMLISVNEEGKTVKELFRLPSNCECVLKRIGRQ